MTKISDSIYSSYNDFINKNIGEKKIVISVGSGGTSQPFEGATKESLEKAFKEMIFHEFKDSNFSSNYNPDEYKKEYFDFINKFYNELITSDKAFVDFWSTYMMNSGRYSSKYSIVNPHYTREGKSVDYKDLEHYPDSIFYKYKNEMSSGLKKAYVEYMKEYAGKDIDLNKDANKKEKYTRKDGDIEIIATKNTLNIQASKGMLGTTSYPKAFEQLKDASNVVNKQEKIKINFNPVIMPTSDAFSILNKIRKYAEDYGFKLDSKLSDNGKDEIEDIDIGGESYAFLINKHYNPELPEWLKVGNKYDVAITEYKNGEFVPTGAYKEMTLKNIDKWVLGKNGNEKGIVFEIEHGESATITSIPYSKINYWIDNNMIKITESIPVEKLNNVNNDIKEKKVGMKKINTYSVKNWSEIPTVWKNTKEVKKVKYTNSPFDKELVSMLEPIAADDDLRPVMNGVNFDEYGITATNAHILVSLPYPNEKYKGTYATIPKRNYTIDENSDVKIKDSLFIPNKYPQYPTVIPKIKDALRTNKINVYKLLQWTEVALKYCNKGSFNALYWFGDTSISFNAKFMIESMKLLLKLGYSEVYYSSSVQNRAIVFSPDKKYELGKSVILLLMPVIKNAPENLKGGSFDIDFSRELLAYYDFSTDEIRNADDSVADFKMFYGDYDVMPENEIKMLNKFAEKNTTPILDYFVVRNSKIHASDMASSLLIKHTELQDGLYDVLDGAIERNESIDSDEYPLGLEVEDSKIKFIISSNILDYYIDLSLGYVSKDKYSKSEMSGILFDYKDSKMYMVSTDGSILSKIDITKYIEINKEQKDFKFILSINNLTKFFNNIEDSAVTISASDKVVSFENNDYIFSSRLIIAKAINYDSVISWFNDKKISLSKKELLECLKSDVAQKFIKKYKKEKLVILHEFDTDGKLNIFIGKTSSYTRNTPNQVEDKEKIGTINYAVENGTFQIRDSALLIMPVRIENVNLFALDIKYLTTILDSLNCDSFDFLNKGIDTGYFITGSCLDYGKEIKPIASYKSKVTEPKEDNQIEELESLIELLKEVVTENPKDLDSSDALELYEETLAELKKVNSDKFAKGGNVSDYQDVPYWTYRGSNASDRIFGTIEDAQKELNKKRKEDYYKNVPETLIIVNVPADEKLNISKRYMVLHLDKDYKFDKQGMALSYEDGGEVGCGCKHDSFAEGGEIKSKKVIRRNLPINKEYKLVDSFYTGGITDNPMSCQNCGRIIANVAVIEDEDGKKYDVGMDCAETLSQIKSSSEFNIAQNDFAEANAIRTKIKNALKKYPDAVLTVENTYYGTVNIHVRNERNIFVNSNMPKEFVFKYLPDLKNKIINPEKNGFMPKTSRESKNNIDVELFKYPSLIEPKEYFFDTYKVLLSRVEVPNYNQETGEIRNYNNRIIVKVFKGDEIVGEGMSGMARDIARDVFYIIAKHDFENFKEQFKNGGYVTTLSYSEILKRLKDEFGIDESDGKSIHGSDLMRIIQVDKNLDPNSGMNLSKVLTDNGWTIIKDNYKNGGSIGKTVEELNKEAEDILRVGKIETDIRNEEDNTRTIIVEIKPYKEYALIVKKNGNVIKLAKGQNELSLLLNKDKFEEGGVIGKYDEINYPQLTRKIKQYLIDKEIGEYTIVRFKGNVLTIDNLPIFYTADEIGKLATDYDFEYMTKSMAKLYIPSSKLKNVGILNYMGNKGDEVVIEKKGSGHFETYSLTNARNFSVIDMFFDSKEEAKKYADKKGLAVVENFYNNYKNGGEVGEKELYYAVYNEHTLGLLFINESGHKKLLVLHGSPLKGSPYTYMSMPLSISDQDLKQLRKATEKDFDEYRVALPPDFKKLNIDKFENGGYINIPSEKVISDFYKSIKNNGANTTVGIYKKEGLLTDNAIDSLVGKYATGLTPKEAFELKNKITRNETAMKKGDIIYFNEKEYGRKYRGEILDTLNDNEFLVSRGIKTFIVNGDYIIGLAPKKEDDLFNAGVSIYDERVSDINSTKFYLTYAIGNNPFEVSYNESNEYGYGIYSYDSKDSSKMNLSENSRVIKLVPSVKKPLIFLNDDGSSFNTQYKEAYDNAVKYDGIKSKDEFTKKMIEQGYDSMLVSDIHGLHLVLFYNDPELYKIKSDLAN